MSTITSYRMHSAQRLLLAGRTVAAGGIMALILISAGCAGNAGNASGGPSADAEATPTPASTAPASKSSTAGSAGTPSDQASKPSVASSSPSGGSTRPSTGAGSVPPGTSTATGKSVPKGSIKETVAPGTVKTAKPVRIEKTGGKAASFGDGVTVRLTAIRHRYVKAKIPGQVSGASVIFDLTVRNGSRTALNLNPLVVNVTDANGVPAQPITSVTPAAPMPNLLRPASTASGTFVFVVPKGRRDPITVDVTISADLRVVVFRGDAS